MSREEVLEILKFAEDNGLMHEMPATDGLGESAAICNCCSCSQSCFRITLLLSTCLLLSSANLPTHPHLPLSLR